MSNLVAQYSRLGKILSAAPVSGDTPAEVYRLAMAIRRARFAGTTLTAIMTSNNVVIWEDGKWKTTSAEYKRVFGM